MTTIRYTRRFDAIQLISVIGMIMLTATALMPSIGMIADAATRGLLL